MPHSSSSTTPSSDDLLASVLSPPDLKLLTKRLETVIWGLKGSRERTHKLEKGLQAERKATVGLEDELLNLTKQYINAVVRVFIPEIAARPNISHKQTGGYKGENQLGDPTLPLSTFREIMKYECAGPATDSDVSESLVPRKVGSKRVLDDHSSEASESPRPKRTRTTRANNDIGALFRQTSLKGDKKVSNSVTVTWGSAGGCAEKHQRRGC
jgi:hypothetical protein